MESLEKAVRLNPRDPRASGGLGNTYFWVRRYGEALKYQNMTIALSPDEFTGYLNKARTYWTWTGDVDAARSVLEAIPASHIAEREVLYAWFRQELYEGRYREALDRLVAMYSAWNDDPELLPMRLLEALTYDLSGEREQARRAYEAARNQLEKELEGHPRDYRRHPALRSALGLAYAGLGRRKEAMREGEGAVAFLPVSIDAPIGAARLQYLALIYTMVGEHDAALDQIETLLSIPSHVSVALLQLDPRWGPLRSHPRFQALLKRQPEA